MPKFFVEFQKMNNKQQEWETDAEEQYDDIQQATEYVRRYVVGQQKTHLTRCVITQSAAEEEEEEEGSPDKDAGNKTPPANKKLLS